MRILIFLFAITFVGCSKDKQRCWECDVTQMPGTKVDVCNNSSTPPTVWTDGVGNNAAVSNCKRD